VSAPEEPEAVKRNREILETIKRLQATARHKLNIYPADRFGAWMVVIEIDRITFVSPPFVRAEAEKLHKMAVDALNEMQEFAVAINRLHPPTEAEAAAARAAAATPAMGVEIAARPTQSEMLGDAEARATIKGCGCESEPHECTED
jgi:hypothetical protein